MSDATAPWLDLAARARHLMTVPVTADDMPDVAGAVQALERALSDYRRGLMAELAGGDTGTEYRVVTTRSARRSYNTPRLLADLTDASTAQGVLDGLLELVALDVVRIGWQWTNLRRVAGNRGLTLRVASREIDDDDPDGAHVGEIWTESERLEPVNPDGEGGARRR